MEAGEVLHRVVVVGGFQEEVEEEEVVLEDNLALSEDMALSAISAERTSITDEAVLSLLAVVATTKIITSATGINTRIDQRDRKGPPKIQRMEQHLQTLAASVRKTGGR